MEYSSKNFFLIHFDASGENTILLEVKDAKCKQGLVERCEDSHKQRPS